MTEDWALDVRKHVSNPDETAISGIIRYCGISLQKRDSSLVSFIDQAEVGRVRENFLRKKLGLTEPDPVLNAAIDEVAVRMKGDRTKNRVTAYYLLAEHFKKLHLFGGEEAGIATAPALEPEPVRERIREPEAVAAGVGVAALGAGAAMGRGADRNFTDRAPAAGARPAARAGMGWLPWVIGAVILAALAWWFLMRRPAEVATAPVAPVVAAPSPRVAAPVVAAPAPVVAPTPAAAGAAAVNARVHFANASAALTPEDRAAIRDAAASAKADGGTLAITGYTDNTGTLTANQALANRRANAVRGALMADGVPAAKIVKTAPANVQVGATPASDPEARRVDIARQ